MLLMASKPVSHVQALLDRPEQVQPEGLEPVQHGKFTLSASGLQWQGVPTIEEWAEVGHVLAVMDRGLAFLIGDWIRFGEAAYGEMAAQVIDARTWRPETVRNYVWLAEKVPVQNRMLDRGLTVSHHQAVAALTSAKQHTWLRRAQDGHDGAVWPVSRLKAAIREGEDLPETAWRILITCASRPKRDTLLKKLELDGHQCKALDSRGSRSGT
jgi:hypothetical protein